MTWCAIPLLKFQHRLYTSCFRIKVKSQVKVKGQGWVGSEVKVKCLVCSGPYSQCISLQELCLQTVSGQALFSSLLDVVILWENAVLFEQRCKHDTIINKALSTNYTVSVYQGLSLLSAANGNYPQVWSIGLSLPVQ